MPNINEYSFATPAEMREILGLGANGEVIPAREQPQPSREQILAGVAGGRNGAISANATVSPAVTFNKPGQHSVETADVLTSCDNPADFHEFFWPDFELFNWQRRTLLQLAGFVDGVAEGTHTPPHKEAPVEYALVAANGSGKSAIVIARYVLWFIAHSRDNICVVTSATFDQLKNQTFRAIHRAAQDVNAIIGEEFFECTECCVKCPATRGLIEGIATDRPGRAEGYHPEQKGELAFVADEAKSIPDEMFIAFSRYTGYSAWIEVSSPAFMSGHFYKRTTSAATWEVEYTHRCDRMVLGQTFARRVTAYECPGAVPRHQIEKLRREEGENSYIFKTSILAEFGSIGDCVVIPFETTLYERPARLTLDEPLRAGLDISLGGDETVLSIWQGNHRVAQKVWRISDTKRLVTTLISAFVEYGLSAPNITGDNGGIGKIIIQLLHDAGWPINRVNNETPALNKKECANRGMELYWKVKRLVEDRVLVLPHEDDLCMKQLTQRRFEISAGRMKLESKADLSESPDRSDAMCLAFATVDVNELIAKFKAAIATAVPPPDRSDPSNYNIDQLLAALEVRRARKATAEDNGFTSPRPVGTIIYAIRGTNLANTGSDDKPAQRTARFSAFIKQRRPTLNIR